MPQEIDSQPMKEAIARLGNYRIGAVALCNGIQANSDFVRKAVTTFGTTNSPEFEDSFCAVYPSSQRNLAGRGKLSANSVPDYQGNYEVANCETISGWVWDRKQPDSSVSVGVYDGETRLLNIPANQYRQDLWDAGVGNGRHSFVYTVPEKLKDGQPHSIQVKTSETGFVLFNSPRSITCSAK